MSETSKRINKLVLVVVSTMENIEIGRWRIRIREALPEEGTPEWGRVAEACVASVRWKDQ